MGRKKIIIEDNFHNIVADMRRMGMTAVEVTREELATTVGDIIDHTPQDTGMAASGWAQAADILDAEHKPIRRGRAVRFTVDPETGKKTFHSHRSAAAGRRMSHYDETHNRRVIKSGKRKGTLVHKAVFLAENDVPHFRFLEHGVSAFDAAGGRGARNAARVGGYLYAEGLKPLHIVRNAVRRQKQRVGPHLQKSIRTVAKRPRHKPKITRI